MGIAVCIDSNRLVGNSLLFAKSPAIGGGNPKKVTTCEEIVPNLLVRHYLAVIEEPLLKNISALL